MSASPGARPRADHRERDRTVEEPDSSDAAGRDAAAVEDAAAHLLALLNGEHVTAPDERLAAWRTASAFTALEVTLTELGRSRRRRMQAEISAFGETKSAAEWADDPRFPVTAQILVQRIASGMRVTDALTLPVTRTRKPEERASLQVQFLALLRTGDMEVPDARQRLGIPGSTLASWMRGNPAFKAAVAQAVDDGAARAQRAVLDHIRMGSTLTGAAQRTGVHPRRISTWRREDPAFVRRLEAVLATRGGRRRPG
ncbi:hypothetical protein G3I40_43420 [Streptomyces sp. SID14478]|uniref:hypothetical protein n=1 Tax=Streptomyces sp. SID14478 TaxID=2706073 RepID=UPI0013DEA70E|nr:hypothetical protein [Streptomyces sp. SID14478]NEB82014.1 hypothetical protein [Streptomyces sp. SID14478]